MERRSTTLLDDKEAWDAIAKTSYFASPALLFEWCKALARNFPEFDFIPLASNVSVAPRQYVCPVIHVKSEGTLTSLPFVSPGFLSHNVDPLPVIGELHHLATCLRSPRISLQVPPGFEYGQALIESGFRITQKVCFFEIDLRQFSGDNEYKNLLSRNVRRDLRLATKSGVLLQELLPTQESLARFLPFYHENMKRHLSSPMKESYLLDLVASLAEICSIWVCTLSSKQDLGGAITFGFGDRFWVWLLASAEAARRYCVDSYLWSELVSVSIARGYRHFDMGTTPIASSLGSFKKRMGGEAVFHDRYEIDTSIRGMGRAIFKTVREMASRHVR